MVNLETSKAIALKLASLDDQDASWVLSQLDESVRLELEPLMIQVRELGIDQKQLQNVLQSYDVLSLMETDEMNGASEVINNASYQEIMNLLAKEHPYYYQILVSAFEWKWKSDSNGVNRLNEVLPSDDKPLLKQAVIKVCEKNLIAHAPTAQQSLKANTTIYKRLKHIFRGLPRFRKVMR